MRIVDVRESSVSLRSRLRNAWISFSEMDTSLVAVVSDVVRDGQPIVGLGFSSIGRYAQTEILRRRLIPRLLKTDAAALLSADGGNFDPHRIWAAVMSNEKPGGHGERAAAVGALDMAIFDLVSKIDDQPLYRYLANRYSNGEPDEDVFVYAAGGYYYPDNSLHHLRDEIRSYLDLGYTVVKLKIGGAALAEDQARVEAVIEVVGDPSRVAVDANGRFNLRTALRYAEMLEPYGLSWYEEPGDPLDFDLQAQVSASYRPPLATGENLFSHQDARNLVRYAEMRPERDYIQIDPSLSYGLVEYLRTLEVLSDHGWSSRRCIPHGGHQLSLHVAAGLHLGGNESYPDVFQPIGGFADNAPVVNGRLRPTEIPGIGIEEKTDLYRHFRELLR